MGGSKSRTKALSRRGVTPPDDVLVQCNGTCVSVRFSARPPPPPGPFPERHRCWRRVLNLWAGFVVEDSGPPVDCSKTQQNPGGATATAGIAHFSRLRPASK